MAAPRYPQKGPLKKVRFKIKTLPARIAGKVLLRVAKKKYQDEILDFLKSKTGQF